MSQNRQNEVQDHSIYSQLGGFNTERIDNNDWTRYARMAASTSNSKLLMKTGPIKQLSRFMS